jgi:hypothetical protein
MPFTVSHVAAVLPAYRALSRARLFTAAVIGSMVPDFGMLLPEAPGRLQTHSALALFTFCLPVGLLLYWITVYLIKPAIVEILPDGVHARLRAGNAAAPPGAPRTWLHAASAIVLGAATHIIWDGFTHENAPGVRMFPVLDEFGPEIDGHSVQLYRLLQYGSSFAGLAVVIVAVVLWLRHAPAPASPPARPLRAREREAWISLYILLPLLALIAAVWLARHMGVAPQRFARAIESLAIMGMRAGVVTLLLVSLLLRARLSLLGQASRP